MTPILPVLVSGMLLCLLLGCRPSAPQAAAAAASDELPADFLAFYADFHTDSLYQLNHIQWPLTGVPDRALEPGESFAFQRAEWTMQRAFNPTVTGYLSNFTVVSEDLVIEKIINPKDQTGLERRFLRRTNDGDWELIYYQGVRKLQ